MRKLSEKKTSAINQKFEQASRANQQIIHIMPQEDRWIIKRGGTSKAYRVFKDLDSAIAEGKNLVEGKKELIVHSKDGKYEKII